jgi:hypothetical protein
MASVQSLNRPGQRRRGAWEASRVDERGLAESSHSSGSGASTRTTTRCQGTTGMLHKAVMLLIDPNYKPGPNKSIDHADQPPSLTDVGSTSALLRIMSRCATRHRARFQQCRRVCGGRRPLEGDFLPRVKDLRVFKPASAD